MAENTTFDPALLRQNVDVNLEEDAYSELPPPPEQRYTVELTAKNKEKLADTRTVMEDGKVVSVHYVFNIYGVIRDPGGPHDGEVLFPHIFVKPSTKLPKNRMTTTAISLIQRAGFGNMIHSHSLSHEDQKDLMLQMLNSKPLIEVRTQWRATKKTKKMDEQGNPTDKDEYKDIYVGMDKFPLKDPSNPELGRQWQIPVNPLDPEGETVNAVCEIVEFLPRK